MAFIEMKIIKKGHRVSWAGRQGSSNGTSRLELSGNPDGGFINFMAAENGEKSGKEVYMSYQREDVLKIRDFLNSILGEGQKS